MDQQEYIDELIIKCLSGEAGVDESKELSRWMDADKEHLAYFLKMKNIWDISHPAFDIESIQPQYRLEQLLEKIKGRQRRNRLEIFVRTWQRIAAFIAVPLLLSTFYLGYLQKTESTNHVWQELNALYGTRTKAVLPDGSVVWMNGGSTLRYPLPFEGKKRDVELKGEGYFQIAPDKKRPFIVHTPRLDIEALGTEFNVYSYDSDSLTQVTLVTGSVCVSSKERRILMNPNERIVYNHRNKDYQLYLGNPEKWCSWKQGELVFRNEPLQDIFKRLSQMYNISFQLDEMSKNLICHATFKDESLDRILHLLEKTMSIECQYLKNGSSDHTEKQYVKISCKKRN